MPASTSGADSIPAGAVAVPTTPGSRQLTPAPSDFVLPEDSLSNAPPRRRGQLHEQEFGETWTRTQEVLVGNWQERFHPDKVAQIEPLLPLGAITTVVVSGPRTESDTALIAAFKGAAPLLPTSLPPSPLHNPSQVLVPASDAPSPTEVDLAPDQPDRGPTTPRISTPDRPNAPGLDKQTPDDDTVSRMGSLALFGDLEMEAQRTVFSDGPSEMLDPNWIPPIDEPSDCDLPSPPPMSELLKFEADLDLATASPRGNSRKRPRNSRSSPSGRPGPGPSTTEGPGHNVGSPLSSPDRSSPGKQRKKRGALAAQRVAEASSKPGSITHQGHGRCWQCATSTYPRLCIQERGASKCKACTGECSFKPSAASAEARSILQSYLSGFWVSLATLKSTQCSRETRLEVAQELERQAEQLGRLGLRFGGLTRRDGSRWLPKEPVDEEEEGEEE